MNKYIIMSIICFISGIALIGLGISRGEGEVYWAVIFPIFHGNGIIFFLGSILLILGIVLMMIGFVAGSGSIQWGSFDDLLSDEDYEDDHPEQYPSRHGRDHRPYKKGYNEPLERRPTK